MRLSEWRRAAVYEVGSRLLVSRAHRWGGTTDADLLAWDCGFTRYYDDETARDWRAAAEN